MDQSTLDTIRTTLEEELVTVERQLRENGATLDGERVDLEVDEGFADSAAATSERSEVLAQVEQAQTHRSEVVGALKRLDDGSYGKCQNCGRDIAVERLEALPATPLCIDCAQAEQAS
ncbi:MAG: TraR/DksA C4-type zinc finger protein [Actinomycetota bacterium]|nr:TraR/DksA C4-type zinc finger protein [Actinomycetota bacterium]